MKTIFNIFAKKAPKSEEKPMITIDTRERNSLVISEILSLGVNVNLQTLKVADYIVGDVAIERKTISDFISSMINKRLLRQLEELQQYENRLLIVEGIDEQDLYTDSENVKGMHPNSIRGFLLSILLNYKVPIIFTKDYADTARFLSVLARKKPREMSLKAKKKAFNKKEQMQIILEAFPGIGPKTSKKLLKEFKTIKSVINSSEEKLKKILGKKAEIVKKIVEEEY